MFSGLNNFFLFKNQRYNGFCRFVDCGNIEEAKWQMRELAQVFDVDTEAPRPLKDWIRDLYVALDLFTFRDQVALSVGIELSSDQTFCSLSFLSLFGFCAALAAGV